MMHLLFLGNLRRGPQSQMLYTIFSRPRHHGLLDGMGNHLDSTIALGSVSSLGVKI